MIVVVVVVYILFYWKLEQTHKKLLRKHAGKNVLLNCFISQANLKRWAEAYVDSVNTVSENS